jgi:hypothetical protein
MSLWNVYQFELGSSGLIRRLLCRDIKANSDAAAIDTVCKHLQGVVKRGSLFARDATKDDWQVQEK